jgi:hypothetical protein
LCDIHRSLVCWELDWLLGGACSSSSSSSSSGEGGSNPHAGSTRSCRSCRLADSAVCKLSPDSHAAATTHQHHIASSITRDNRLVH